MRFETLGIGKVGADPGFCIVGHDFSDRVIFGQFQVTGTYQTVLVGRRSNAQPPLVAPPVDLYLSATPKAVGDVCVVLRTAVDICQTRGDVRGIRFDFVGAGSGRVEERGAGNGYDDQVSKHLVSLEVSAKGLSRLPARDEHCDSNQLANGCRLENGRSLIQDAAMAGNSSCRFAQKS